MVRPSFGADGVTDRAPKAAIESGTQRDSNWKGGGTAAPTVKRKGGLSRAVKAAGIWIGSQWQAAFHHPVQRFARRLLRQAY